MMDGLGGWIGCRLDGGMTGNCVLFGATQGERETCGALTPTVVLNKTRNNGRGTDEEWPSGASFCASSGDLPRAGYEY